MKLRSILLFFLLNSRGNPSKRSASMLRLSAASMLIAATSAVVTAEIVTVPDNAGTSGISLIWSR